MSNLSELELEAQKEFEFTQSIRKNFIIKLTENNQLPSDTKEQKVLLEALRDMDNQNINRLRIKVEDKATDVFSNMGPMVTGILKELKSNAFTMPDNLPTDYIESRAKKLPEEASEIDIVPGELDTVAPQGNYEDFIKRMKTL